MTPEEIATEYRRRYVELAGGPGRSVGVSNPKYWELEAWYSAQHAANAIPLEPPVKTAKVLAPRPPEATVVQQVDKVRDALNLPAPSRKASPAAPALSGPRLCSCGNEIVKKPGRGRYPLKCLSCKAAQ